MDENKRQLDATLREVAKHFPGWTIDPRYHAHCWCAALIDDAGRGIHFNTQQSKGRLYVSGTWPRGKDGQVYTPRPTQHITIARDRPPSEIALEIKRRFLPWYLEAYTEQAEHVATADKSRQQQQETTLTLATLLGDSVHYRMQSDPNQICTSGLAVDVHRGGGVSIQIRHANLKVAKAVLKAYVRAGGLPE